MENPDDKEVESEEKDRTELGQGTETAGQEESELVDWNGFISGDTDEAQGDLWPDWKPSGPVTPEQVLRLAGYTRGESIVAIILW